MNAEHEEAAMIDRLMKPKFDEIKANGGVFVARRVTLDAEENPVMNYIFLMPVPTQAISVKVEFSKAR